MGTSGQREELERATLNKDKIQSVSLKMRSLTYMASQLPLSTKWPLARILPRWRVVWPTLRAPSSKSSISIIVSKGREALRQGQGSGAAVLRTPSMHHPGLISLTPPLTLPPPVLGVGVGLGRDPRARQLQGQDRRIRELRSLLSEQQTTEFSSNHCPRPTRMSDHTHSVASLVVPGFLCGQPEAPRLQMIPTSLRTRDRTLRPFSVEPCPMGRSRSTHTITPATTV